jgi:hypothetical protein
MPLVNLKTNLKSIKYGKDQRGGGWSGQPFVQFPIEGESAVPSLLSTYYKSNRTSLDWPIRGGGTIDTSAYTPTISGEIDLLRISKFLKSAPRGKAFIDKQVGLQLSNPKSETGTSLYGLDGQKVMLSGLGIIENTRVYNKGVNTLTQIKLSGTGVHVPRIGSFPLNPTALYYADIVGKQNTKNDASENRLLTLYRTKVASTTRVDSNAAAYADTLNVQRLGIASNRNMLFSYLGGPESTYGIGVTQIKRYVDTSEAFNKLTEKDQKTLAASSYDNIMDHSYAGKINQENTYKPIAKDGSVGRVHTFYTDGPNGYATIDKLNYTDTKIVGDNKDPWSEAEDDMIKFGFECIDNDNPSKSLFLQFRAFLTSGISDNHSAAWNSFKYMGRGEDFYTYQGFSRSISFGFRIAAGSKSEMDPLYSKLNALVSQVYPDYSPSTKFMRAPIVRVTVGNYIYRMAGVLDSVNVTVANDATWEIDADNQLPMYLDVQVSFKPIMNELPQRQGANLINNAKPVIDNYSPSSIPTPSIDLTPSANVENLTKGKTPGVNLNALFTQTKPSMIAKNTEKPITPQQYLNSAFSLSPQPYSLTITNP